MITAADELITTPQEEEATLLSCQQAFLAGASNYAWQYQKRFQHYFPYKRPD